MGIKQLGTAEDFAVRPTVGGVGVALVTELGGGADVVTSKLAPTADVTIPANTSAVVVRKFTIATGKKLIIGAGARFRIL